MSPEHAVRIQNEELARRTFLSDNQPAQSSRCFPPKCSDQGAGERGNNGVTATWLFARPSLSSSPVKDSR